jgi:hypothetical protein
VVESLRIGNDWARCPSFGELFLRSTLGLMRGFLYLIRQLFFPVVSLCESPASSGSV